MTLRVALVCVLAVGIVAHRPQAQAPATAPADALFKDLTLAEHRAGEHGRARDGHRRGRGQSGDGLCRRGVGRRLEVGQRRHDVGADLHELRHVEHRRRHDLPEGSQHRLGRHRRRLRAQQRSWGDGVYKSTDAGKTFTNMGLARDAAHCAHHHAPDQPGHRVRRRAGTPLGLQPGTRRLQDDRRRQDVEETRRRTAAGRRDRRRRSDHGSRQSQHPLREHVGTHPQAVHLRERRSERRPVQDDERRRDVDEARRRAADGIGREDRPDDLPPQQQDPDGDRRGAAQHGSEGARPGHLSIRRRGRDVDVHESDGEPAVLLQPHLPGSEQREPPLRARRCRRRCPRTAARRSRATCRASKATSTRCGSIRRTAIASTSRTTRARR